MKIFLILPLIIFLSISCTKKAGMTTSKIRIVGGKALSGNLATRANKGLIFYGKSNNGHTFTKKIDNDFIELAFPNGAWNFYAVSWEDNTISGGMVGHNYCAKVEGVQLNGSDVNLNLNLTNATCADPMFTISAKQSGGYNILAQPEFISCRNVSGISGHGDNSLCDATLATGSNKGTATYIKLVIPEYKSFAPNEFTRNGNAIESDCIAVDPAASLGLVDASQLSKVSSMRLPHPGASGLGVAVQVYFSEMGCDQNEGFDEFYFKEGKPNPKLKTYAAEINSNTKVSEKFFYETHLADACRAPRLNGSMFGSGLGHRNLPYVVCNKLQFDRISANFGTLKNKSFDLFGDIDFNYQEPNMIGVAPSVSTPSLSTDYYGGSSTSDRAVFNGNGFKLKNFMAKCTGGVSATYYGLFRILKYAEIKNLTVNNAGMACESKSDLGIVAGHATDTNFSNIKIHGFSEGTSRVGALVGNFVSNASGAGVISKVVVQAHVNGYAKIGGILGAADLNSGVFLSEAVFFGEIDSHFNGATPFDSFIGGVAGEIISSTTSTMEKMYVKADRISGSKIIGGFIGKSQNVAISDSYSTSLLQGQHYTNGSGDYLRMGGMVGQMDGGSLTNSFVFNIQKDMRDANDHTFGGLVGDQISAMTCTNTFYPNFIADDATSVATPCRSASGIPALDFTKTVTFSSYDTTTIWEHPDGGGTSGYDIPRLRLEASLENVFPVIKRLCQGRGDAIVGAGTQADPEWICTVEQFNNMVANKYYILKKSMNFVGSNPTEKAAGVYYLDGNNFGIMNFLKTYTASDNNGYYGLFKTLNSGSVIKNLKLINNIVYAPTMTINTSGQGVVTGILTGNNKGTITNVTMGSGNKVQYLQPNISNGALMIVGGLVGFNEGTIEKSRVDAEVFMDRPDVTPAVSSWLIVGGAVGKNYGLINGVKHHGMISRKSPISATYDIKADELIGGFVGRNSGTISSINTEGEVYINNYSSVFVSTGKVSPFVAWNEYIDSSKPAMIKDNIVQSRMNYVNYNQDSGNRNKFLPVNTNGTVLRTFFEPRNLTNYDLNYFDLPTTGAGNTVTDLLCFSGSAVGPCYTNTMLSYTVDGSNVFSVKDNGSELLTAPGSWSVLNGMGLNGTGNYVWRKFDSAASKMPELINASGNFDEIGPAFN